MTHIDAAWHAPYRAQQAFNTNLVPWHLNSQVQPHKHKRECGVRCLSKSSVQDRCDSRCVQMVLAPELHIKLDHQLIALSLLPQQQVTGPTSASKIFSQIKNSLQSSHILKAASCLPLLSLEAMEIDLKRNPKPCTWRANTEQIASQ